jgi:hypothetical protein
LPQWVRASADINGWQRRLTAAAVNRSSWQQLLASTAEKEAASSGFQQWLATAADSSESKERLAVAYGSSD